MDANSKNIIIYQRKIKPSRTRKTFGLILLSFSLAGILLAFSPLLTPLLLKPKPVISAVKQKSKFKQLIDKTVYPSNNISDNAQVVDNFTLTIEKLNINQVKIFPQVRSETKNEYQDYLKQGIAQAEGSSYPDEQGLIYLYGHSSMYPWLVNEYQALLWNLEELSMGDRVKLNYNGKNYLYYVTAKKIVKPEEVSEIKEKLNDQVLVIQTCTPRGTALKRLLIFCEPSKFGGII